jgi:hypothetical protein
VKHYPRRRDANHGEIVNAFIAAGASTFDLGSVGGGLPDVLFGIAGKTGLAEIKNPQRRTRGDNASKTLERQKKFRDAWRGMPVFVVWTVAEALAAVVALSRS